MSDLDGGVGGGGGGLLGSFVLSLVLQIPTTLKTPLNCYKTKKERHLIIIANKNDATCVLIDQYWIKTKTTKKPKKLCE